MQTNLFHRPFLVQRKDAVRSEAIGWIALVLTIVGGCTFNGFAKVLSGTLSPFSLLFISEVLTMSFVALTFGLIPMLRQIASLKKKDFAGLLGMGIFGAIIGPLLWFTGLHYTYAVNAVFFGQTETVFLVVMAHFFLKEEFRREHAIASATILAGVAMIAFRGFSEGLVLSPGDLIIICAGGSYSAGSIVYRKFLHHIEPEVALFFRSSMAITVFFLVSPFLQHSFMQEIIHMPLSLIPALLGFGFMARFLNSVSFYEAIQRLPVSTVTLFDTLEIVGGAVFAFLYVGEPLLWYHAVGGAFILAGTLLLEFSGIATRTPPAQVPGAMMAPAA